MCKVQLSFWWLLSVHAENRNKSWWLNIENWLNSIRELTRQREMAHWQSNRIGRQREVEVAGPSSWRWLKVRSLKGGVAWWSWDPEPDFWGEGAAAQQNRSLWRNGGMGFSTLEFRGLEEKTGSSCHGQGEVNRNRKPKQEAAAPFPFPTLFPSSTPYWQTLTGHSSQRRDGVFRISAGASQRPD